MESRQDRSFESDSERSTTTLQDGKFDRIASHTQGLVSDLREWIDLRIDLAVLEIEERVDELRNEMALGLTVAVLGFFGLLFVLTAVALGVGWLLGHPFWGFLIVSVLLLVTVGILHSARPALVPPSNLYQSVRGDKAGDGTPRGASSAEERAGEGADGSGPGRE